MESFTEIARYGSTGVAIAALAVMWFIVKEFFKMSAATERRHEASYKVLTEAIDKNAAISNETLIFMRRLNGSLPLIVAAKKRQKLSSSK